MTDKSNSTLYLPVLCVVPIEARRDKTLTDAAKIYLGELNVLAQGYGYCWASDENLAQMKGVCLRTIKNWNTELTAGGYITRDTWRSHVMSPETGKLELKTKRKIYVTHSDSKNLSEGHKIALHCEGHKIALHCEGQNSALIKKEPLNTKRNNNNRSEHRVAPKKFSIKRNPSDSVAVFSCLKDKDIPEKEKIWITKNFTEKNVEHAVAFVDAPSTKIETTYIQTLKWACKEQPKIIEIVNVEENRQKAVNEILPWKRCDDSWRIEALNKNLEFTPIYNLKTRRDGSSFGGEKGKCVCFPFDKKSFCKDVAIFIRENIPSIHKKMIQV